MLCTSNRCQYRWRLNPQSCTYLLYKTVLTNGATSEYPNMPEWLSPAGVYSAWLAQTAIGVLGYVLTRLGHKFVGLGMLTAYAAFGFYGLAHYLRAPLSAHTLTMNVTIWL